MTDSKRSPGGRVANIRLANRVIWALEDIDQSAIKALSLWDRALVRAELRCADPALLILLSRMRTEISDMRTLAVAARDGEYAGKRRIVNDDPED